MRPLLRIVLLAALTGACDAGLDANTPPIVSITSPADSVQVVDGQPVDFQGSASDVEDLRVTGAGLQWNSSIDGALGQGATITGIVLSLGDHTITLTATDSEGATGADTLQVLVLPPPFQLDGSWDVRVQWFRSSDGWSDGNVEFLGTAVVSQSDFGFQGTMVLFGNLHRFTGTAYAENMTLHLVGAGDCGCPVGSSWIYDVEATFGSDPSAFRLVGFNTNNPSGSLRLTLDFTRP